MEGPMANRKNTGDNKSTQAQIQHVFREANRLADKLANEACEQETAGECRGIVNTDKAEITSLQIKTRKITVRQYISRGVKRINRETHTEHHEQTCITVNKTKLHSLAMSAYRKFQLQKMMPSSQVRRVDAETEEEIIYELDCEHLEISMSASAGKKKIILVNEEEEKID